MACLAFCLLGVRLLLWPWVRAANFGMLEGKFGQAADGRMSCQGLHRVSPPAATGS